MPTRGPNPPSRSNDVLVTSYEYGWEGASGTRYPSQDPGVSWTKTTDPAGIVHWSFRDNLGRDLRLIRRYVIGGQPGSYWDAARGITVGRNLTTTFAHDGSGHLVRAVAWEYDPRTQVLSKQVTGYEYGVLVNDNYIMQCRA